MRTTTRSSSERQSDVLDLGIADRGDAIAPAPASEIVEPALPFLEQRRGHQRAQPDPVPGVPRRLDLSEHPRRFAAHSVGREGRIVLGRLRGRELHLALALPYLAPRRAARARPSLPPSTHAPAVEVVRDRRDDQSDDEEAHHPVREEDEVEDRPEDEIEGKSLAAPAAPTPAAAAAAAAKAAGAAAGRGERVRGDDQRDRQGEEEDESYAAAAAHAPAACARGPTPGWSWAMCWSA
jgi:hypothetical protein